MSLDKFLAKNIQACRMLLTPLKQKKKSSLQSFIATILHGTEPH